MASGGEMALFYFFFLGQVSICGPVTGQWVIARTLFQPNDLVLDLTPSEANSCELVLVS